MKLAFFYETNIMKKPGIIYRALYDHRGNEYLEAHTWPWFSRMVTGTLFWVYLVW